MTISSPKAPIPSGRDLSLDALKAFLALGVIYIHTLIRFPEDSLHAHGPIINSLIIADVPAFYFVAGMLFYPLLERIDSLRSAGVIIGRRFRQLIVPALILTLIPSFSEGVELLLHFNTRFYFLVALFDIIVVTSLLSIIIHKLSRPGKAASLILFASATTILLTLYHDIPLYGYFHWRQALHGNLFFVFGILAGMFPEHLASRLQSHTAIIASAIIFIIGYYIALESPETMPVRVVKLACRIVAPICGIIFLYGIFRILAPFFSLDSLPGKTAYYLSARSLPLYIMQELTFLILFSAFDPADTIHADGIGIVVFLMAVVMTLAMHDIVCLNRHVESLCFGRRRPLLMARQIFTTAD